jgi:amino acid transporter
MSGYESRTIQARVERYIYWITTVTSSLIVVTAVLYSIHVGSNAEPVFWGLMYTALWLLLLSGLLDLRRRTEDWKDRPERQGRLHFARALIWTCVVAMVVIGILLFRRG